MGEFTHSWNHVGEFSAKRVTTSSFAGTTKPILLGKKKKNHHPADPSESCLCCWELRVPVIQLSWIHQLSASSPWRGATCKDHSGYDSGSPQSRWSLPSGCPQLSSATFTQPAVCRPRRVGRALLLLLLLLQMLTTVPPPVVGSACHGSMLSLT